MILIIAEKPSLGRNIAAGIGPMQKRQGYLEGDNYIITWAFGHLFSLCDIETWQVSFSKERRCVTVMPRRLSFSATDSASPVSS